jgi:uncharacterized protein with GYD domain
MHMARYLIQAAYSSDSWAALINAPHDRATPIKNVVEEVGGHLECFYFSFGEYDIVSIVDMPDNVTAAAVVMKAAAGPALKDVRTTPLLTIDESVEALTRAQGVSYQSPGDTGFQTPIYAG